MGNLWQDKDVFSLAAQASHSTGHRARSARQARAGDPAIELPARVLIADDHAPTRVGLRHALEACGFSVVAEAADAGRAIELALHERPDICLLDVDMPGDGIRAASALAAVLPGTAIVMLSASSNDADLFDALRAGAAGFLLIDTNPARLPDALRGVLAGEAALPRKLVSRLIHEFCSHGRRKRLPVAGNGAELTIREWEVLTLMHSGHSTADIAKRLFVSPVTVRRHVSAVVKKLGVPNREAAIRLLDECPQTSSRELAAAGE